jgi:hypothetical protein
LDALEKQLDKIFLNDDLTINFSFIGDSIIKMYFKELDYYYAKELPEDKGNGVSVRDLIRNRLLKLLIKYQDDEILLIAHSMGSIIAYDVLNYTSREININTLVTIGSPLGFPVIMGKIAADRKVKLPEPEKLKAPEAIRKKWYNLSDLEDKVALIYRLGANFDANSRGVKVIDKIIDNNYSINGKKNPHKSYGYLRSPEMATILTGFLDSVPERRFVSIIRKIFRTPISMMRNLKSLTKKTA